MKKLTSKWKSLNKNGIKLSLICGLNWLIGFVTRSQFYLFSAAFLGLMTYYLPHDLRQFPIIILDLLFIIQCLISFILRKFRGMKSAFYSLVLLQFFVVGNHYVEQHALTESMVAHLFRFWLISFVLIVLVSFLQPRFFKYYLFKKVINKEYLGIRKPTDELPPKINFYTDAEEAAPDKRMRQINQHVIKKPYQGVVELSFLNREVITGIGYQAVPFEKEKERVFMNVDTIYYPVFRVYPFGITGDFSHTLIKFQLSRIVAFLKEEKGFLKE